MTDTVLLPDAVAPLRKRKKPATRATDTESSVEPKAAPKPRAPRAATSKAAAAKTAVLKDDSPATEAPAADTPKPAAPKRSRKPKASASAANASAANAPGADDTVSLEVAPAPAVVASAQHDKAVTVEEPADALPPMRLDDLPEALRTACANAGWAQLMPVQERSLPYLLQGRDLMVQSRTGSGKTGAYLLPLLERLKPGVQGVQALVLVPTRELASQVEQEARTLFAGSPFSVAAVYGGVGYGKQMDALRQGVTLVVGTPGRVLDHLLRRTLVLDKVTSLIFDEADRMLSIGFYPDMKEIQRYLPHTPRHAMLFSATYPPHVLRLAGEFLHDPELLSLSTKQVHVAEVQHRFCQCNSMDKDRLLLKLLEVENPGSAIIFCNTKATVHFVTAVLQGFGLNADELSADLSQSRREDVLARLRRGEIRFLVATDVAARGIDIPELSHVILYEPPEDRESYIHRAGRTGRAGAAGVVISLVDIMQKLELGRIAKFFKIPLEEQQPPTDDEVSRAVGLRVTAQLEARLRQLTGLEKERMSRLVPLIADMAADPEQQGLLAMALDDVYQKTLPAPAWKTARQAEASAPAPRRDNHPRRDSHTQHGNHAQRDGHAQRPQDERSAPAGRNRRNRRGQRSPRSGA